MHSRAVFFTRELTNGFLSFMKLTTNQSAASRTRPMKKADHPNPMNGMPSMPTAATKAMFSRLRLFCVKVSYMAQMTMPTSRMI